MMWWHVQRVLALPRGNAKMIEIATAIQIGAITFLRQEYTWCSTAMYPCSDPVHARRTLALPFAGVLHIT